MTGRIHDFSAIPAPGPWTEQAACKGYTDLFFEQNHVPAVCRSLCRGCPVFEDCLAYALEVDVEGIWAGTTVAERERMRRRRRIA